VNNIGGNVFCLIEIEKKVYGTAILDQFMLAWSGVEKSERAKAGVTERSWLRIFKIYNMSLKGV
jgi:hypothetical protein